MAQPLNSWKAIAGYLGCSVRTAQRWQANWGLPVHRPSEALRGPVLASPTELDAWVLRDRAPVRGLNSPRHARMQELRLKTRENARRLRKQAARLVEQMQRATTLAGRITASSSSRG